MPGFFNFMKRMAQGKPIYDANDTLPPDSQPSMPAAEPGAQPAQPTDSIQKGNAGTFPVVCVRHVDIHINGSNMEAYAHIANESSYKIFLDKLRAFGTERRIAGDLPPHGERSFLVYAGPQFFDQNHRDAYLDYRTDAGDYFEARHDVSYMFHGNSKTYTIDEMRLRPPIRDIYG